MSCAISIAITRLLAFPLALAITLASAGCGSDDTTGVTTATGGSTSEGGGEAGGEGGAGGAGGGDAGAGGEGGSGGQGGAGGTAPTTQHVSELVNAGEHTSSNSYSLIFTMGQPTQNQQAMTSPSYRLQGGLVGAMGSLP